MPYRVTVPDQDKKFSQLPARVRTRVWLDLAQVAQLASDYPSPRPAWVQRLGIEATPRRFVSDGYNMLFALDDGARTVTLLDVAPQAKSVWPA